MKPKKNQKADLEKKKVYFLEVGFVIALLFVFSAFEYQTTGAYLTVLPNGPAEVISEELPPVIPEKPKVKPPPPPVINLKVVDNPTTDLPDMPIDAGVTQSEPVDYYFEGNEKEEMIPDPNIPPVLVADKMPEFPGGTTALFRYLKKNLIYPSAAKEIGIRGTVYIYFVVERDGSITNVKVLRGIGGGCDEEAVRVVQNMPRWKPGIQHGKTVRVSYNLPVKFVLQ